MSQVMTLSGNARRLVTGLSLAMLTLLAVGAGSVQGQSAVGSTGSDYGMGTGNFSIKGTIHLSDGSEIGKQRFKVTLSSPDTTSVDTRTDVDGNFSFNSLTAGNYTLAVEATDEYEAATEFAPIDRAAGSRVNIVPIFLRRKPASDPAFAGVPKSALDAYSKGMQLLEKKEDKDADKKAAEQFNKAVAEYADFGQALAQLGAIYIRLKDYDKAAEVSKKAAALQPNNFDARYNYGAALFAKKDLAGAEVEFTAAVKLRDASALAHMYLGLVTVQEKKYGIARDEFEKAVNLPGGDRLWQAHRYLGGLYMSSDPKRAADELEKYLQLNPKAEDAEKTRSAIKDLRSKAGTS